MKTVDAIAEKLHDRYEELSIQLGWDTQPRCKTEFHKLPDENKKVMIGMAEFVIDFANEMCREKDEALREIIEGKGAYDNVEPTLKELINEGKWRINTYFDGEGEVVYRFSAGQLRQLLEKYGDELVRLNQGVIHLGALKSEITKPETGLK